MERSTTSTVGLSRGEIVGDVPTGGELEDVREPYDIRVAGAVHLLGDAQQPAGAFEELLTALSETHVTAVANQQRLPDVGLELADLLGERGLADVQLGRRAAEVELIGNGDEVPDQA